MAESGWPEGVEGREYVTAQQAADYLQVHTRTVYNMATDGRLQAWVVGGSRAKRFRRVDVEALLRPHGTEGDGLL